MPNLTKFLRELGREPFVYGNTDCVTAMGRWWEINHGRFPGAELLGRYDDEASCAALLESEGGLLRLVRRVAVDAGMVRTSKPKPGDIAVVSFQDKHFGAIRTKTGKWAIKGSDGMIITNDCRLVAAWSV